MSPVCAPVDTCVATFRRCTGNGFAPGTAGRCCSEGAECRMKNEFYGQCVPSSRPPRDTWTNAVVACRAPLRPSHPPPPPPTVTACSYRRQISRASVPRPAKQQPAPVPSLFYSPSSLHHPPQPHCLFSLSRIISSDCHRSGWGIPCASVYDSLSIPIKSSRWQPPGDRRFKTQLREVVGYPGRSSQATYAMHLSPVPDATGHRTMCMRASSSAPAHPRVI